MQNSVKSAGGCGTGAAGASTKSMPLESAFVSFDALTVKTYD